MYSTVYSTVQYSTVYSLHASNCPSILCILFCTFLYINIIISLYSVQASNCFSMLCIFFCTFLYINIIVLLYIHQTVLILLLNEGIVGVILSESPIKDYHGSDTQAYTLNFSHYYYNSKQVIVVNMLLT